MEKARKQAGFEVRTDLALESRESFPGDGGEIEGVSLREWRAAKGRLRMTEVKIKNEKGARAMGKPEGTYLTLELDPKSREEDDDAAVKSELAGRIHGFFTGLLGCAGIPAGCRVLVAGLGNPGVTADALGPRTVARLQATRHLNTLYGESFLKSRGLPAVSAIVPGVTAQTGMETAEILRGILNETKPDLVLAVDALAARSIGRLGTAIQLTDTGIRPGSGVGNYRHGLTEESLGVPVLAVGVPTVVGAAAIVQETMQTLAGALAMKPETGSAGAYLESLDPAQQYLLVRKFMEPEFQSLCVTPPDIDETVNRLSDLLSGGIEEALFHVSGCKSLRAVL